jgi:ligand-binding SRPBCC domain-containing protein
MKPHYLEFKTKLYRPLPEIFEFFSNAENLNKVTPSEVKFSMLTPMPITMQVGALIDYHIKLSGIPFFWRTQISVWEPPYRFVDEQVKGPYVFWRHEHIFEDKGHYVLMTDRLYYLSPGWFLEPLIDKLYIRPRIEKIWQYREGQFNILFGEKPSLSSK